LQNQNRGATKRMRSIQIHIHLVFLFNSLTREPPWLGDARKALRGDIS
jgi:hypothetical protein